jgi:glyoxylase-like metal-dependent hydrolase (beta-lactamase superfamily II)
MKGLLFALTLASATGSGPPSVKLWRLDCGTFETKGLVNSCYLIRHGSRYMLWDAGFGAELEGQTQTPLTLKRRLVDQLGELGVRPGDIAILALSHKHWDHIGQAADFPNAKLLIGEEDWVALTGNPIDPRLQPARLKPWIEGGARKALVHGDWDVFGDGSVVMIATPGHTAGHHALLVRLKRSGPVLLSGDLYDTAARFAADEVARGAEDAEATRRSFAKFRAVAGAEHARIVIQHEPADVAALPLFPQGAE